MQGKEEVELWEKESWVIWKNRFFLNFLKKITENTVLVSLTTYKVNYEATNRKEKSKGQWRMPF